MTDREAEIAALLEERFCLPVKVSMERRDDGLFLSVVPVSEDDRKTFKVEVLAGWRNLLYFFRPADYSGSLMKAIARDFSARFPAFRSFTKILEDTGFSIFFIVDGSRISSIDENALSGIWSRLEIEAEHRSHIHDDGKDYDISAIVPSLVSFWGAVISLLPLKSERAGEIEGDAVFVQSKRYERSPVNREACIGLNGCACKICGFDFERAYGEIGKGFIHIHHIVPVSKLEVPAAVDPATDLIPVCPNCHAMLHRRNPPFAPAELARLLKQRKTT